MSMPPPITDAVQHAPAGAKPRRRLFIGALASVSRGPQRSVVLALAAGAVGLICAGAGIFHPAPKDLTAVPAGDVALVNQEPILMSDFMDETQSATGMSFEDASAAQRALVLHNMIDQELLVQRSLAMGLPEEDTAVRSALADAVNNQIASGILASTPSDDDLRAFFAAHRSKYASKGTMNLTDLVLHVGGFENVDQSVPQAMADAAQAVYELRSGANIDYVKQHFALADSGKVNGEEMDFAAQIHLGPKLYALAQTMSDGQISDPVADIDGVHVLVMQHRLAPVLADFDSVRNNVYTDYIADQKVKASAENLKFLRGSAQILLAPGQAE